MIIAYGLDRDFVPVLFWFPVPTYTVARIVITILSFTSLRALPADAYQMVNWNKYIQHFGP